MAMKRYFLMIVLLAVQYPFTACAAGKTEQLISNPTFARNAASELPSNWYAWAPAWDKAACDIKSVPEGLLMEAKNSPFAVGGVTQDIRGVEAGQAYRIRADCSIQALPSPYQSLLVRLTWTAGGKSLHPAGMLVRGPVVKGQTANFEDVLVAPAHADGAVLSLELKWPQGGSVIWREVIMQPAPAPKPRKARIGTVFLRPRNSTPEKNLKLWCETIDQAGDLGLDIVCLGEVITKVGTSSSVKDVAKPIPGPVTKVLGKAARQNNIWVVAGLTELDGETVYNTAVLLDREGRLAGKYRKVHLPREEWRNGVTPGHSYPVFKADFGTVAMEICYDWFFPETETIFALKGAEIIFAPTWGNTLPDKDGRVDGESTFRVRARDNGVYMVPSVYSGNSLVIDPMGRILASSNGKEGVVWAEVDLNNREPLDWVGYWRSIGPRHRMQDTFGELMQAPESPTY